MPIREFDCQDCQNIFEKLNPKDNVECPNCGSKNLVQRFSTFSWSFSPYFISLKEDGLD